ncbi:Fatty acid desaturase 2 [Folsomia candida]|uniref:Fatty acid desaturase 2 n=1 Tax=Folsomia candida TaxID=158441 RepID=A0A226DX75_FOLCA|nr:Fatty acid desaturase 2 [Folsomia candida]
MCREISRDPLEILFDGYYYDITEFSARHPGGDVILYYTEKGEDATQAIQQFHNRFFPKVKSLLETMKKRPATQIEMYVEGQKYWGADFVLGAGGPIDPVIEVITRELKITNTMRFRDAHGRTDKTITINGGRTTLMNPKLNKVSVFLSDPLTPEEAKRHRDITNDFNELFYWMKSQGMFESSPWRIICRLEECAGRAGWVMHDAGHHSLTGNHIVDRRIHSIFLGILDGVGAAWWRRRHNKHHAMPQRIDYDGDLNTMPLIANSIEIVKDPRQGNSFFIQNQSKAPWFHSCRSPIKRIKMKNVNRVRVWAQFIDNRREKGSREDLLGSNPHSNAEEGARLLWKNAQKNEKKNNTSDVINKIIPQRNPLATIEVWSP